MKTPELNLPEGIELIAGSNADAVARQLAKAVAAALGRRLAEAPRASLVVSGGSTPLPFFKVLSQEPLEWARVDVALADERWVPESDPASNTALVKQHLLAGPAAAARFVSLKQDGDTPEEGMAAVVAALGDLTQPIDVLVLGMGNDGHTASLFPDAPELHRAMTAAEGEPAVAVHPPSQPQSRITLSFPLLSQARMTALHLKGDDKLDTLAKAASAVDQVNAMPIRGFLKPGLKVFWSA
ncbi:6-phosphogluconolactonase [Spongiibacter sp.]|uniref:6-phosphogluconolactonase n=1 Tax=Spongiibacter sp. TaxID=2024860 RepID=UPI000C597995|nr:6-phosphogluconolactonase [Spongiibacter sp.]MBU72983.1 6-phosphogluconolactonase [Spongiibacter sp.]|tara:strand:- start:2989 stop:3708 length:720 start_codon:yes stop_codon:yes gene_type:complete